MKPIAQEPAMPNRKWIPVQGAEGAYSRQAHADLPPGTFEREMSKEGFFGPAAFFYHQNPPTGWTDFEGPLRPRAFDLTKLERAGGSPWDAAVVLRNSATELRYWRLPGAMADLARNGDGDTLLFIHAGAGALFCDWGRLEIQAGDYVYLPRGAMWRIETEAPIDALIAKASGFAPGRYKIRWQVLAIDGHITRGDIPFTVQAR
jgi:homogentisate 1,2-dioxygenase